MAEYIEREKALKILEGMRLDYENSDCPVHTLCEDYVDALETVEDKLNMLIPADVRPERHGYWSAENPRPKSIMYCCSLCGKIAHDTPIGAAKRYVKRQCTLAYCPNCGAKMDGKEGEQNG